MKLTCLESSSAGRCVGAKGKEYPEQSKKENVVRPSSQPDLVVNGAEAKRLHKQNGRAVFSRLAAK